MAQELHPLERPWVVGLTGSIGMGKSTVANMLTESGVPVNDADATVHAIYARGGAAVAPVGQIFPDAIVDERVDRVALSRHVVGNADALRRLEAIVHPLVKASRNEWLRRMHAEGQIIVVLDIPLLYENKLEAVCDEVIVVSAPADVQRSRVLGRPNMQALPEAERVAKFEAILAKQVPDVQKRARADYVVDTGTAIAATRRDVDDFVASRKGAVVMAREHTRRQRLAATAAVAAIAAGFVLIVVLRWRRS